MSIVLDETTKNRMLEAVDRFHKTVMELRAELEDEINEMNGGGFLVPISIEVGVMERPDGGQAVYQDEVQARTSLDQPMQTQRRTSNRIPLFGPSPDVMH